VSDQAIKIVILLRVPQGTSAEVVQFGQADIPDQAAAAAALRPDPPCRRNPTPAEAALAALRKVGVDHPERTIKRYAPARILQVCQHAIEQTRQRKLKNPPAWVVTALRRGWTVPKGEDQ